MDLKIKSEFFKKKVDPVTGNILFFRKDIKGIPDKVIEGDGFLVEIKNKEIYLIDIYNSEKVLGNLLNTIKLENIEAT